MNDFKKTTFVLAFVLGLMILTLNIYGVFRSLDATLLIDDTDLLFVNDSTLSYREAINNIAKLDPLTGEEYASKVNKIVQNRLAHIRDWKDRFSPEDVYQLVPVWENYILYFMGKIKITPEYERYHFVSYKRSLERGIGLCGDHSMILTQLLKTKNIKSKILSFQRGHVITQVNFSNGQSVMYDPDYGVEIPIHYSLAKENENLIKSIYIKAGYNERQANNMFRIYSATPKIFENTFSFMKKRYIMEYLSYFVKWMIPFLLFLPIILFKRSL